jgi:uncharacterized protein YigE (DUF2233 family)
MTGRLFLLLLTLPAACSSSNAPRTAPAEPRRVEGPCQAVTFEGSRFTVCTPGPGDRVEIVSRDRAGRPLRSFEAFARAYPVRARHVRFAMNAGMYDNAGEAIGLLVESGKQLQPVNRRAGGGNFHLLPNGIFWLKGSKASVTATPAYREDAAPDFATQSGPMLVIDGKLHPRFDADGESRNIRNGVGIDPRGVPRFAISEELVSFGKFARLFRDGLGCQNALYFDGSVSSLWDPGSRRRDAGPDLGPMVIVSRKAA